MGREGALPPTTTYTTFPPSSSTVGYARWLQHNNMTRGWRGGERKKVYGGGWKRGKEDSILAHSPLFSFFFYPYNNPLSPKAPVAAQFSCRIKIGAQARRAKKIEGDEGKSAFENWGSFSRAPQNRPPNKEVRRAKRVCSSAQKNCVCDCYPAHTHTLTAGWLRTRLAKNIRLFCFGDPWIR